MEYLGFWVTRNGVKLIKKQVINNTTPPTTRKGVCKFICLLKYYRDILTRNSQTLVPFTKLTSNKVISKWN